MSPVGALICRGVRGKEQRSSSQKSTEQLFEFFALFVGNVQHTATGEFISQFCDDSFFVCEALVSTFNWVVADVM